MLVRRSAKFRGNSWRKSCEESRRKGAAARPSGGSLENQSKTLFARAPAAENAPFRTDGSEAAPPHLGARCRSQLGSYAPAAPTHSGKSTCDTCSHRRAVAPLRCWQEQAVVRERHPNAPPPNRADAPGTASPPLLFPAVRGHRDRYKSAGTDGSQSAWTGTTVYSVFLSYGAHTEAGTRSSLVEKKCCALHKAQRNPKSATHTAHKGLASVRP